MAGQTEVEGSMKNLRRGSTVFDPEAQTRRELAEVRDTESTEKDTENFYFFFSSLCSPCLSGTFLISHPPRRNSTLSGIIHKPAYNRIVLSFNRGRPVGRWA